MNTFQKRIVSADPAEIDEITLEGRKVRVRNIDIPLEEIVLDPTNPRIANTLAISAFDNKVTSQHELEEILWADTDVHELYRQILINGGLIERIILRADGSVVEGNCRTVVFRKLRENRPKDQQWRKIPARVLPDDIGARDVAILLGEMHVAGKNTWSPFEKAGHIYRMHRDFALTQDEIAHRLRMSKSKVNQLLHAFEIMKEKFLRRYPMPSNIRKFSYFEELYKKPPLREWISKNPHAEDQFVDLVGTGKLNQGVHVRELPLIIANSDAMQALIEHGFEEAKRLLEVDDPAITSKLFRRMKEMTTELEQARLDDIQRIKKGGNSIARKIVLDLHKTLNNFVELCDLEGK
jgi:hypothetical protein